MTRDVFTPIPTPIKGEGVALNIPPYRETRLYVPAVLAKYREWQPPPQPAVAAIPAGIEYLPGTRLDPKSSWKRTEIIEVPAPPRYSF